MRKEMFKYNNVVCAEALMVFPDMLLLFVCAIIGILSLISQNNLFVQIPSIVYWICGGIAILMNVIPSVGNFSKTTGCFCISRPIPKTVYLMR